MKLQYQAQVTLWTAVYAATYAVTPNGDAAAAAADRAAEALTERVNFTAPDSLASLRADLEELRAAVTKAQRVPVDVIADAAEALAAAHTRQAAASEQIAECWRESIATSKRIAAAQEEHTRIMGDDLYGFERSKGGE